MTAGGNLLTLVTALGLGGGIAVSSLAASRLWGRRRGRKPNSLLTHGLMAALSLIAMAGLSHGDLRAFGLTLGSFRWSAVLLLWAVPTAVLSLPQALDRRSEKPSTPLGFTPGQVVLRVWIVASIAEELLTRGLVQGLLAPLVDTGFAVGAHFVSLPVLVGAATFSALHLVLLRRLRTGVVPILILTFSLGCVAGVYREATGSLVPAVLVHVLFNVGGSVPAWIMQRKKSYPGGNSTDHRKESP